MIFICGGACQGKREWACRKWGIDPDRILDGGDWTGQTDLFEDESPLLFDHYEAFVLKMLQTGREPGLETRRIVAARPDLILITDEIGSGIIPMDPFLREYREIHGRLCCDLAQEADEVYRVSCGIGMRIKPM